MIAVPKGQWGVVSTNTLGSVLWRDPAGKTINQLKDANANPETYFTAWNGGALDPVTKLLWIAAQGGDNDGADNGAYAFAVATGLWSRIIDPTPALVPSQQDVGAWPYKDAAGREWPESRHTYGASIPIPGVGAWIGGGVQWHPTNLKPRPDISRVWHATPAGWQGPADSVGSFHEGRWGAWDSIGKRVLFQDNERLRAYDPAKASGSRVSFVDTGSQPGDSRNRFFSGCFDSKRNRLVGAWQNGLEGFGLAASPVHRKVFKAMSLVVAPGILYDPISDRYILWLNAGPTLVSIHPDTWSADTLSGSGVNPGAPAYAEGAGTWGRFGYVPGEDVYLLAAHVQGPVLAYKPVRDGQSPPVVTPPDPPPPPVDPPPPPSGSLADLPTRVLVALEGPPAGRGVHVAAGMKHVTGAHHPPSGRLYFVGGDYRSNGNPSSQSYVQEGWSLDLRERWVNRSNTSAGWREEWPYCAPAGAVQPKHPDFVGWVWDAARRVFGMVPGMMVALAPGQDVCAGETAGEGDDPAYKHNHLMTFDPTTRVWADLGPNVGADQQDSWMSTLDPALDRIIRFGYSGSNGGVYNVLTLATMTWTRGPLGLNALGKDWRVFKEYMAPDFAARVIYAIDGVAGRLGAFSLDTLTMADLGAVPGGPILIGGQPTSNYAYPVWDSAAKRLVWLRGATFHVYDPAARAWETFPAVTSPPGLSTEYRTAVYDPGNNVTLFMGGVENPNVNMLLFRYAPGSGMPPVEPPVDPPPPPPVVTPDVTITLGAGVKYKIVGGVAVP